MKFLIIRPLSINCGAALAENYRTTQRGDRYPLLSMNNKDVAFGGLQHLVPDLQRENLEGSQTAVAPRTIRPSETVGQLPSSSGVGDLQQQQIYIQHGHNSIQHSLNYPKPSPTVRSVSTFPQLLNINGTLFFEKVQKKKRTKLTTPPTETSSEGLSLEKLNQAFVSVVTRHGNNPQEPIWLKARDYLVMAWFDAAPTTASPGRGIKKF